MKNIIDLFNTLDREGEVTKITLQDAIDNRDHKMLTLAYIDAFRTSNIINVTLKEVQAAQKHEQLDAFVFKNIKYKTSLIHGAKIVSVPTPRHHHLQLYIKLLRPMFVLDAHRVLQDRHLFVPSKQFKEKHNGTQLDQQLLIKMF